MMLLKIIFAALMVYVLGCSLMYVGQESMIFYPEVLPQNYKYSFPGRFDELMWDVNGVQINALHFKADTPKGVVLYFHGNAGSLRDWGDVAFDFLRFNYDVLIPDYRGYGKSTGKIKNEGMLHTDAAVAYNYLKGHYPEDRIVIYGRSIGSGVGVHLAKSNAPRMLILESPYYNFKDVAAYHYPFIPGRIIDMILRYTMRADQWIPHVSCPVYIIHGTDDNVIPYSSGKKLFELVKTHKELITIQGGGHNDLSSFGLYSENLGRILK